MGSDFAQDVFFTAIGVWLYLYRTVLQTRIKPFVERTTTFCAGVALTLIAPTMPLFSGYVAVGILAAIGMLFGWAHPALTALVVSFNLSFATGGLAWNLGLCGTIPEDGFLAEMPWHPLLLSTLLLIVAPLLTCVPGTAGPLTLIMVAVPLQASLLLTVGLQGLLDFGGLSATELFQEAPCGEPSAALRTLGVWAALGVCNIIFQLLMAKRARAQAEEDAQKPGGGLVASLLPNTDEVEGPSMPSMPQSNDRFQLITKAIFSQTPIEDLEDLTETERKLVKICREDEFERDRVLWGGGLI
mmetsp:Transcript_37895/g.57142  ORF Transcript_37895/g.57142 Transcript_37895/m.57142 type:complete len:300 (-) Transcript_37895:190-1089(-)|eukprot:CAMPEP_0206432410 /NCGR_PEP_ID=MMETSP0324_2-20121206/7915_1 /ASSEMBLY_ACC=CAM_ASM_000836 /TAXON_ID=2866 /ORGANISM="Crypthecodinium cohnii, Strain Seligo" /LENGTH=299 /DNA_ID=CAMNT_0053898467 /DNA_START=75 /DNA_END=974 /DNA_ORIENTATION=+